MSAAVLNSILWCVFLVVFLTAGVVFCLSGYKKGIWRALQSLGVTVGAFILSLLLAKLIAPAFVPAVSNLILVNKTISSMGNIAIEVLADGVCESILSLLLFVVFLLLFTIVFKIVTNRVLKEKYLTEEKRMRYFGMGIRAVDAFIFTVLLLLPLYGTLSVYTAAAQSVLDLTALTSTQSSKADTQDANATGMAMYGSISARAMSIQTVSKKTEVDLKQMKYRQMLESVNAHPLMKVANTPPIKATYCSLGTFKAGGERVGVTEMVSTADELLRRLEIIVGKPASDYGQEEEEFLNFLRDDVVHTQWFFAIYCECLSQAEDALAVLDVDAAGAQSMLTTLKLPKEDFDAICVPLLDFADYLVSTRMINELIRPNVRAELLYEEGFFDEVATLLNSNEQMAAFKALLLRDAIQYLFGDNPTVEQIFAEKIHLNPLTEPAQLRAEAEAIVAVLQNAASWQRYNKDLVVLQMRIKGLSVLEALARHPMFGVESIEEMMQQDDFHKYLGFSAQFLSDDFEKEVLYNLKQSVSAPVGKKPFMLLMEKLLQDEMAA